jgi:hypothetical protein
MNGEYFKFSLKKLPRDARIVVIGGTKCGKSTLIKGIMKKFRNIPDGIVISNNEARDPFFKYFIPDTYVYKDFSPDIIKRFLDYQGGKVQKSNVSVIENSLHELKGRKILIDRAHKDTDKISKLIEAKEKQVHKINKAITGFCILDDCSFKKNITKTNEIREMYMNGRHCRIFSIYSMQNCMDFDHSVRSQVSHVFIFFTNVLSELSKIYKHFVGMFKNEREFIQVFNALTKEPYHCLVIDRTVKSSNLNDCVFWYCADEQPKFKVGGQSYWKAHEDNVKRLERQNKRNSSKTLQ